MLLSSAANAGERPSNTAAAVPINKRFMFLSLSCPCNRQHIILFVRNDVPNGQAEYDTYYVFDTLAKIDSGSGSAAVADITGSK
jgi:hypothetical protein